MNEELIVQIKDLLKAAETSLANAELDEGYYTEGYYTGKTEAFQEVLVLMETIK